MKRAERVAILGLLSFTAAALLGYWAFALHPEWLPQQERALKFYSISFRFFAQIHIAVAALALAVPLVRRGGGKWIPGFMGVFLVSFLSEFIGTGYGIPFGGYGYTALLGVQLGGRVPALIPVSWFLMAVPSFVLAQATLAKRPVYLRLVAAAALLVIWDLALDPAMSYLTPYWVWEETGPYYGMPWMNLLGWFATGVVLMALLSRLGGARWSEWVPPRFSAAYYGAVLLMPLGMVVAAGEWLAVVVTLGAVGVWAGVTRLAGNLDREAAGPPAHTSSDGIEAPPRQVATLGLGS
jgi:putative membrane protein